VLNLLRLEPLLAGLHGRGVRELGRHGCWRRRGGRRGRRRRLELGFGVAARGGGGAG
jgi:hypothetical protein